jgi:hypothetical protein
MSEMPRLIYTPCHGATPATELSALAACYRFLLRGCADRRVTNVSMDTGEPI